MLRRLLQVDASLTLLGEAGWGGEYAYEDAILRRGSGQEGPWRRPLGLTDKFEGMVEEAPELASFRRLERQPRPGEPLKPIGRC